MWPQCEWHAQLEQVTYLFHWTRKQGGAADPCFLPVAPAHQEYQCSHFVIVSNSWHWWNYLLLFMQRRIEIFILAMATFWPHRFYIFLFYFQIFGSDRRGSKEKLIGSLWFIFTEVKNNCLEVIVEADWLHRLRHQAAVCSWISCCVKSFLYQRSEKPWIQNLYYFLQCTQ